ncbi:MAG: histidine phosphatase family protein [Phycisphaerales bacterium]
MARKPQVDVLLLRSGRTAWEDAGRVQGGADLPMTDGGRAVAASVINHALSVAGGLTLGSVYCPTDEASYDTAKMLADRTGSPKIRRLETLDGAPAGLWEGQLESEAGERYPTSFAQWREDPTSATPPEGEPTVETEVRLLSTLARVLERTTSDRIGVVLRPFEYGLIRCVLAGRPVSGLWTALEDGPSAERRSIPRVMFREQLSRLASRV